MPFDGIVRELAAPALARRLRTRRVSLDFETFNEAPLVGVNSVGGWQYSTHPSARSLMVANRFDEEEYEQTDLTEERFPARLEDALLDPRVEKWAFNAAFERLWVRNVLKIDTPYEGWRCTMALATQQGFVGSLGDIGAAMGLPEDKIKLAGGKRLIQLFCQPQRITKKNPHLVRDKKTDPEDWAEFLTYNIGDVIAEDAMREIFLRYSEQSTEWEVYEEDQRINDRGLPVNRAFVEQAEKLSDLRRGALTYEMHRETGLSNPGSRDQLLPWLQQEGYPFDDLQKDTIKKVLNTDRDLLRNDEGAVLTSRCGRVLRLRQQASRTSVKKYPRMLQRLSNDGFMRHCFQYGGAARTLRWAGRGPQPHNMVRTPKWMEAEDGDTTVLDMVAEAIEEGDYDWLSTIHAEPMEALAGSMRSSIQAPLGYELRVCDLKAIESAVVAWLSKCKGLLDVFKNKLDPYRSFATRLYGVSYDAVTSVMRTICKPAVLGCAYGLGGGMMREGKKTGLAGYAEGMGVELTFEEAAKHVAVFRETYHEIPVFWSDLMEAAKRAMEGIPSVVNDLLTFRVIWSKSKQVDEDGNPIRSPLYLTIKLPSGRVMYYYKPRFVEKEFEGRFGKYTRTVLSYMGRQTNTHKWTRIFTSGPKLCLEGTTPVLTDRGWVPLAAVRGSDRLWDGNAWITHSGVVFQGVKNAIQVDGVGMTPDHRLLTKEGWKDAEKCGGFDRADVRLPRGVKLHGAQKDKRSLPSYVETSLRLRSNEDRGLVETPRRRIPIVRMHAEETHRRQNQKARHVSTSSISCLALDEGSLRAAHASGVGQLWRSRNNSLLAMEDVRELLGGYGTDVPSGADAGAGRQRERVQQSQLRLDDPPAASQQPTQHDLVGNAVGTDDGCRGGETQRDRRFDVTIPAGERMRPVFDILNAGPRHCFTILGSEGPILSHNCENVVQAVARDVLVVGMMRAAHAGFRLVGHVHDELIALQRRGNRFHTVELLRECMRSAIDWAPGLPLDAAGFASRIYRKD